MNIVGDIVLAEWKDERFYPATVMSVSDRAFDVRFAENRVMSVQQHQLVKCSLIPVGCTVLAKRAVSDLYEPAVIQTHHVDSYVVLFPGQTAHERYDLNVFFTDGFDLSELSI